MVHGNVDVSLEQVSRHAARAPTICLIYLDVEKFKIESYLRVANTFLNISEKNHPFSDKKWLLMQGQKGIFYLLNIKPATVLI